MDKLEYTFFRVDRGFVKVIFKDVMYVEACMNYVKIKTKDKSVMVLMTLRQMEELLMEQNFCRVQRSLIINLDYVTSFDDEEVRIDKIGLPVGKIYRGRIEAKVHITNCDTRLPKYAKRYELKAVLNDKKVRTIA